MWPDPRHMRLCQKQFVDGEVYPLVPLEARSRKSHAHFFATLHDIWENLPEDAAARFPLGVEQMRKWALVEAGYADEKTYVCDTHKHAMQMAAFIRSISDYAVIRVSGDVVKVFEAKSQSAAAMGRETFQDSKTKVLDICAALTSTPRTTFEQEAQQRVPRERGHNDPGYRPGGIRERAAAKADQGENP